MVKNKIGGNKAKKFARKNVGGNTMNRKIRYVTNEDEIYCVVTKMVGNGQCVVLGNDNRERLCFIRNKFSGRNKQSNLVCVGSWIIAGIRSWESQKEGKLQKCDLLEIYNDQEKHSLLQESQTNFDVLLKEEQKMSNINQEEDLDNCVSFGYEQENRDIIGDESDGPTTKLQKVNSKETSTSTIVDGIDFDDI
jgi:hypothetical protein